MGVWVCMRMYANVPLLGTSPLLSSVYHSYSLSQNYYIHRSHYPTMISLWFTPRVAENQPQDPRITRMAAVGCLRPIHLEAPASILGSVHSLWGQFTHSGAGSSIGLARFKYMYTLISNTPPLHRMDSTINLTMMMSLRRDH